MGCVISVWSPVEKTGKTVLTYLLAHKLTALSGGRSRVLLCCGNSRADGLQKLCKAVSTVGMEDLVNIGKVSGGERLNLYGMLDRRNSMYFIGSSRSGPVFVSRYADAYRTLIREFKGLFDLVLADTPSDTDNPLGKILLEESDHIVNLLPSEPELLYGQSYKNKKDIVYLINKNRNTLFQVNELTGIYPENSTFRLPYCGKLADFHKRRLLEVYSLQESEFNNAFDGAVRGIASTLGISGGCRAAAVNKPRKMPAPLMEGSAL